MRSAMKQKIKILTLSILVVAVGGLLMIRPKHTQIEALPHVVAEKKSFSVEVRATGELETARSIGIASSIRGDQAKLIYIAPDGTDVAPGELLIRIDPSPFEERLIKLRTLVKEQQGQILALEQALSWELDQTDHEVKAADCELAFAQLELEKLIQGDGPLETAKLKNAMQKAWVKYEEVQGYSAELEELEKEGFLHPSERYQAKKKLEDEYENYQHALMQYESYIFHVYPMLVKKAESHLKKAELAKEDRVKNARYRINKAEVTFSQAKMQLNDIYINLHDAEKELELTELKAPSSGMVVHRDEYRMGQRRKPRLGDVLIKNQILLDLPDLDSMIVKAKVREVDLFKIAVGKKTTIHVDAYPNLTLSGKVIGIGVLAISDFVASAEERFFEVRVAMDHPEKCLRPGMTARVSIHAFEIPESVVVPVHALFQDGKEHYCYVKTLFGHKKLPVKMGRSNEYWAELLSGVQAGDRICLANPFRQSQE